MFNIHNGFSQIYFLDLFHNCNENRSQPDFQIPRVRRGNFGNFDIWTNNLGHYSYWNQY